MTEKKAGIINTIKFAKKAIAFEIGQEQESRYFYDRYPLFGREMLSYIASCLKPEKLKELMHIYGSLSHGKYILDSVFPKYENPEDFHSTESETCLTDNPVQVLSLEDTDKLIQQGVEEGLDEDWISRGFEKRALERGIDLEWHFFSEPRDNPDKNITPDTSLLNG